MSTDFPAETELEPESRRYSKAAWLKNVPFQKELEKFLASPVGCAFLEVLEGECLPRSLGDLEPAAFLTAHTANSVQMIARTEMLHVIGRLRYRHIAAVQARQQAQERVSAMPLRKRPQQPLPPTA